MKVITSCLLISVTLGLGVGKAEEPARPLRDALRFHASFDQSGDADFARGDTRIYTAKSLERKEVRPGLPAAAAELRPQEGRYGGCLQFLRKTDEITFFQGGKNMPYAPEGFSASLSFWLRLDPDRDLPAGYVDPLQITDKKWNDASLFVDFTKELPRQFRLGAFSNYAFWNPQDRKWEDVPDSERPLVTATKPPFQKSQWTHVAIVLRDFNVAQQQGLASLYLNGKPQGTLRRPQQYRWDSERLAIMLGIYYVGGLDDFAIFDRPLSAREIEQVIRLPQGIKSLRDTNAP